MPPGWRPDGHGATTEDLRAEAARLAAGADTSATASPGVGTDPRAGSAPSGIATA
jgi:hypothetical protein